MFRIAVIPAPQGMHEAIRLLRGHVNLAVVDLRERLSSENPVADFELIDVAEIRRCRALLRDVERLGAGVRVFEDVEGFGEEEESVEYLRNAMRRSIQIARRLRDEDDRRDLPPVRRDN